MATVAAAVTPINNYGDKGAIVIWTPLTTTNADGAPVEMPASKMRSVQIFGTFGAGGSIRFEGSNNGQNWDILTDPQGTDIVKTAADLEGVQELPRFVRPLVTAGDGTTSLTVIMTSKS